MRYPRKKIILQLSLLVILLLVFFVIWDKMKSVDKQVEKQAYGGEIEFAKSIQDELTRFTLNVELLVMDTDGNEVELSEVISNNTKMLIIYNNLYCTCIDEELRIIREFDELSFTKNIIAIMNFMSFKDYVIYSKGVDFSVYKLITEIENLRDYQDLVFYCTIDNSFKLSNVFLPLARMPNRTRAYLEGIKTRN